MANIVPTSTLRSVLITGASSGIGLALAQQLWSTSHRVVITARESSLPRLASEPFQENERFLIRTLDVTSDTDRRRIVDEIIELWGGVDVLINNAGISYRAVVEHMSEDDEYDQVETNYFAPLALLKLVLPAMRERCWGRIINVSSVGGMMAMPTMGSYSASKFALEGASEALWYELKPWNIAVSLVQPGFINSDSFRHVRVPEGKKCDDSYAAHYTHMDRFISRLMNRAIATPDSVARKILALIDDPNPPLRLPATIDAYFFSMLRRFLPRRLYHWVLYRNLPGIQEWENQARLH